MALLDIRQRTGWLFVAVVVGHIALISAQVNSRRGVPMLEEVIFGAFAEVQRASADIVDRGIVLTGGGSMLKNLDKRLREETGLPLAMAEDPLSSVVLGAGKMLSDFNLLRKISID